MWLTRLEQLADPKYGLTVRFVSGWKRRGASGGAQMHSVKGVLWHHTAGARSGNNPSRAILINGRPGLSGPLCHINFMRDGTVEVVGAGKANHAGKGIVRGVPRNAGNTRLIGIEMESAGTRPWDWTAAQLREMPKLGAALSDIYGLGTSEHWGHKEYSSTGKIDPAGLPGGMAGLRSRIAATRVGGGSSAAPAPDTARPWRTSPRVAGMSTAEVRKIQQALVDAGYSVGSYGIDGSYGDATGTAVKALQQDLGITTDGIYGPGTETALMSMKKDIEYIRAVVVENQKRIGRVPARVLDAPVDLQGTAGTGTTTLRTKIAYAAHEHRVTQAAVAKAQAAVLEAVQETGKAQGLTDQQVQAIATAAAEASARVSAEDVAEQLTVTTRED